MAKSTQADEQPLSRKDIRELIQLIRRNEIHEFELIQGDLKLRILTRSREDCGSSPVASDPAAPASGVGYPLPPAYYYPPPMPAGYAPPMPSLPGAAVAAPVGAPTAPVAAGDSAPAPAESAPAPKPAEEDDPSLKKVASPMVGTFYRAPAPTAKPYVDVGMRIEEESVLCIVEAMKLMNEIKAEMRGTVRRILVENGQPVEYGQALFLIDPA